MDRMKDELKDAKEEVSIVNEMKEKDSQDVQKLQDKYTKTNVNYLKQLNNIIWQSDNYEAENELLTQEINELWSSKDQSDRRLK